MENDLSRAEVETGKVDEMFNSLLILGYTLGQAQSAS